ncbi:MAG: RDD family protein [Thermodesulfobacteriota bacterium]
MTETMSLEDMHPWPLPRPAGWTHRALGWTVDLFLLWVVGVILALAEWAMLSEAGRSSNLFFFAMGHPKEFLGMSFVWSAAMVLTWAGYFVLLRSACGRTCGEAIWGLWVTRSDGGPARFKDALRRAAWAALSILPLGAGYWWAFLSAQGLTWHDRLSKTRVVRW